MDQILLKYNKDFSLVPINLWLRSVFLQCFSAIERYKRVLIFVNFHYLGPVNFGNYQNARIFQWWDSGHLPFLFRVKSFSISLTKQTSRSGFSGHWKVLWLFTPISWKQGFEWDRFGIGKTKIVRLYCRLCLSCSQILSMIGFLRKKLKSIYFEYLWRAQFYVNFIKHRGSIKVMAQFPCFYGKVLPRP